MSDLRVTNLKGRTPGSAPTLPDGVVIAGITTVSSVIVGTGITLSSSGINVSGVITATSFVGSGANLTGVSGVSTTGSVNTSGIITATSVVVSAGTTALPSISPSGDSNTGIFFPSADTIAFGEGGAEAMRVDSSGRLLIGISTSGNANGGILQLISGITFPASQSASTDANTLDDYEEGTWTPALTGGTLTVNSNGATYTKIGNRVLLTMDVSVTSVSAGNIAITGVPFTVSGITVSAVGGDQFDFTTALIGFHGYIDTASIFFFYYTTGSNGTRLTNSNIRASTTIRCSFQYKI